MSTKRGEVKKVDERDLLNLFQKNTPAQISKILKLDPRIVHRLLRNAKILNTLEPEETICLRIKDTEKGRRLAEALHLKVGVIYPENHNKKNVLERSNNQSSSQDEN